MIHATRSDKGTSETEILGQRSNLQNFSNCLSTITMLLRRSAFTGRIRPAKVVGSNTGTVTNFKEHVTRPAMHSCFRWFALRLLGGGVALAGSLVVALSPAFPETTKATEPTALKPAASSATASAQAVLPNGATALSETYNDWQVICAVQDNARRCVAKQEQINQQSRQMVLTVELTPVDDKVEGVALLPFGLSLDSGVTLQVDDLPAATPLRFKTCVPGGCLIALSFDNHSLSPLRTGGTLKAKVMVEGGTEAALNISLKGLSAALDRTAALLADKLASLKK